MSPNLSAQRQRALNDLPHWGIGQPTSVQPISGGLTNVSYLLTTRSGRYVLRLNNPNAKVLGLCRDNERKALAAISQQPYAPKVIAACPHNTYLVTEFIDGVNFAQQPPTTEELAQLQAIIDAYQALTPTLSCIDYQQQLHHVYACAERLDLLDAHTKQQWLQFQETLAEVQFPSRTFCHGDLTPANIIRSGSGLKVIDWEFATLGEPLFDLYCAGVLPVHHPRYQHIQRVAYWLERLWLMIAPKYALGSA